MKYKTIDVKKSEGIVYITIDRLEHQNSINGVLLKEFNQVLDKTEADSDCKMVAIRGKEKIFCTGMDFNEVAKEENNITAEDLNSELYIKLLKRFTLSPQVLVSLVDGEVTAGGVGLVAASDLVLATPESEFGLSEALWGLLPAIVTPFLIQRVGFQVAYRMALTTIPMSAEEAHRVNLVDELTEDLNKSLKRFWLRVSKVNESTIKNIKKYFRDMWIINDQMEKRALEENLRLSTDSEVIDNIINYIKFNELPWDD